jgi:hypothetical protein
MDSHEELQTEKTDTMIALLNIYSYAMLKEMHSTMLLAALKDAQCMYHYFRVMNAPRGLSSVESPE